MKQESPTFKKIFHKGLNSEINRKNAIDLIKSKVYDTWDMGYFTAVKSILDPKTQKKYALQIDSSNDKESLKYFMKRFNDLSKMVLSTDFESGYYTSWKDYANFLIINFKDIESVVDESVVDESVVNDNS